MSDSLRIIFAGTPDFAARHLDALLSSEHEIVGVFTQPDRPAGRGKKLMPSPVKVLAEEKGLPVFQPASLRQPENQQLVAELKADVMVVVAYGLILPKAVLDMPRLGCINVHGSLLPRWRGAAPIQRALWAGDAQTGVTIMQMDVGLDTGDMLYKLACPVTPEDTSATLYDKLAALGPQGLIETLQQLAQGSAQPQVQDEELVTYAEKLSKDEARMDWSLSAEQLERCIRAFNPWPMSWFMVDEQPVKVWKASVLPSSTQAEPGTIIEASKSGIQVATAEGILNLESLQPAGKKSDERAGSVEFAAGMVCARQPSGLISYLSPVLPGIFIFVVMKKQMNLRSMAAQAVEQVIEQGQSLSNILPPLQQKVTDKDKALLQELCFGVLRVMPQLDWLINKLMSRPMTGKQRTVHYLIMVGLYQLLHTRIPAHAALAETVEGAVVIKRPQLKGLINGVLRQFQRQQEELLTEFANSENRYLFPAWLLKRVQQAYPQQWSEIVEASNQRPPMWLRVNRQHHTRDGWLALLEESGQQGFTHSDYPDAVRLENAAPVMSLPGFSEGWVTVQDAAAQGCITFLAPQNGERVLDLCAAPGGKTTHILEAAPQASVLAVDVDEQRLSRVYDNLKRLGMKAR